MSVILLAHAPDDAARATRVANKLAALGLRVQSAPLRAASPLGRRASSAAVDAAARVLLLWSNETKSAPGLLPVATRARDAGKLFIARLDTSAPPAALRAGSVDLSRWGGKDNWRPWRELVEAIGEHTPSTNAAPTPSATSNARATPVAAQSNRGGIGGRLFALTLLVALTAIIVSSFV